MGNHTEQWVSLCITYLQNVDVEEHHFVVVGGRLSLL